MCTQSLQKHTLLKNDFQKGLMIPFSRRYSGKETPEKVDEKSNGERDGELTPEFDSEKEAMRTFRTLVGSDKPKK